MAMTAQGTSSLCSLREAIGDSESSPCRVGIPVTRRPEVEAVFPTRREWVKHAARGCTKRDLCYDVNLPSWIDFASVAHPPLRTLQS